MNLPWSNWTSSDVFPTPLSPTRIVCKDPHKEASAQVQAMGELGARHLGRCAGAKWQQMQ